MTVSETGGRTRRLERVWPFLWSVIPGRGVVRNLPPKPARRKRVRPESAAWSQGSLI